MLVSIASPLMQPSPNGRRVGIRIVTFEACSGFTHVTARRIAQPPTATFVTRLRPSGYPDEPLVSYQINRQFSGWILPPQVIRAFRAHCHKRTLTRPRALTTPTKVAYPRSHQVGTRWAATLAAFSCRPSLDTGRSNEAREGPTLQVA